MGKFVISQRSNGDFQFNLKAANGEVILTSQGYGARANCENGIASVQRNSSSDQLYDRNLSINEKHFFNLKATNGQVIGTSQMYETAASMEDGIASVKKNAQASKIVDEVMA